MQQHHLDLEAIFFYAINISGLFTNMTLAETIQICADGLYSNAVVQPTIPGALFAELLSVSCCLIQFNLMIIQHILHNWHYRWLLCLLVFKIPAKNGLLQ